MLIHDSDMEVIDQHNLQFFGTIWNVKRAKSLNDKLYIGDRDETTTVIGAMVSERSHQLSSIGSVNVKKSVRNIFNLLSSCIDADVVVSSIAKATDVNG